jgi:hypothetical protein
MASITLARLVVCLSILRFVLPNIWGRAILKKSNTEMHFRCIKSILISYKCITNYMNNLVAKSLSLLIFYFKREYKLIMVLIMCTLDGHISIIYRSLRQHQTFIWSCSYTIVVFAKRYDIRKIFYLKLFLPHNGFWKRYDIR